MSFIKVIDAPCGAGKTSWAIQEINQNPDHPFIFCTPFLDEIKRIRTACGGSRIREPQPYKTRKIEDFNALLAAGESIAVTHVTFMNATQETLNLISAGGYTLILDETLDVLCPFNDTQRVSSNPRQDTSKDDIKLLLDHHLITVDDDYRVSWCDETYGVELKYHEVMQASQSGQLYLSRDSQFISVLPDTLLHAFQQIYVLTYMFEGSTLNCYFEMFGFNFEVTSIEKNDSTYLLIPYSSNADFAFRQQCKDLIHLYQGPLNRDYNLDGHRKRTLSRSWYESASAADVARLKADLGEYFRRHAQQAKASKGEIMWTCPKDVAKKLEGSGYIKARALKKHELQLPEDELKLLEAKNNCFVPCNSRATNNYQDRWALAYCSNLFLSPMIVGLLQDYGVTFDAEAYALSNLIQWIFRSRIRVGKPIELYIPSKRPRELLMKWLDC